MNIDKKQVILEQIYETYNNFSKGFDVACKKYCANCCTRNVTMTTLEGYMIVKNLKLKGKTDLYANITKAFYKKRFLPELTINTMADLCLQGKDTHVDENHARRGECPLLVNSECSIYQVRPFGCRCFVSKTKCKEDGYAKVSPFVFTVNSLFLQYIEHIDQDGCFGNLTDILLFLQTEENGELFEQGIIECKNGKMIPNKPAKVFLIPPEHKDRIEPIFMALQNSVG